MLIQPILVPHDSGAFGRRMGRGPLALAAALRAAGHEVRERLILDDSAHPAEIASGFALAARLARAVTETRAAGRLPIVLAGNCLSALGTVSGSGADAVLWFDAHPDINTPETTTSGFLDGMSLAILTGRCFGPMAGQVPGFRPVLDERVVLAGARDMDPPEAELLAGAPIRHVLGAAELGAALEGLAAAGASGLYLHIDADVHDAEELTANGYATRGGFRTEEVRAMVRQAADRLPVVAVGMTAYDPASDPDGRYLAPAVALIEQLSSIEIP